jgi:UDP-2,3-diacylglucosamine hydrolase
LFDLWLGFEGLDFDYQKPILRSMEELAKSGLMMDYVEGNRDFGISSFQGKVFKEVAPRGRAIPWGKCQIYAEHGDLINRSDHQYRLWRRASKSGMAYWLMNHLPKSFSLRMSERLERSMKGTNLKYKIHYPEAEVERFCKEQGKRGYDMIVFGHFHQQREMSFRIEQRDVLCYNLPGWETGFHYLEIPGDGGRPVFREFAGK